MPSAGEFTSALQEAIHTKKKKKSFHYFIREGLKTVHQVKTQTNKQNRKSFCFEMFYCLMLHSNKSQTEIQFEHIKFIITSK